MDQTDKTVPLMHGKIVKDVVIKPGVRQTMTGLYLFDLPADGNALRIEEMRRIFNRPIQDNKLLVP